MCDFGTEIMRSNPGSTVKIDVEKHDDYGWLLLESFVKREILAAVARDGKNGMYLISWEVIDVECTQTWNGLSSF